MPATRTFGKRVPSSPKVLMSPLGLNDQHDSSTTSTPDRPPSSSSSSGKLALSPLFPCSPSPAPRRPSHHKKRPPSHIPRPPNAFILFRANFIRDRHLHTTSVGPLSNVSPTALSTIVGITWRNLPDEERQIWIEKARIAREEHKLRHPSYRYQPLPTAEERALNRENKRKVKEENIQKPDLERCAAISQFLVDGLRGQDLEEKVAQFDRDRESFPTSFAQSPSLPQPPVRSASLPTPLRRRNIRRQRAYSTSGSPPTIFNEKPLGTETSTPAYNHHQQQQQHHHHHHHHHESPFMSSPELHPGIGFSDASACSAGEAPLPELTYDPASPSSINLPEPQDGGNLSNSQQNVDASSTFHPLLAYSPRDNTRSLHPTPPLAVSTTDTYSSFSPFTQWENSQHSTEPYYQFSYFSGINDSIMNPEPHLSQMTATTNFDPYASSIHPFQLYHTLKPFEQSFHGFPTSPSSYHAFDNEYTYDDA